MHAFNNHIAKWQIEVWIPIRPSRLSAQLPSQLLRNELTRTVYQYQENP